MQPSYEQLATNNVTPIKELEDQFKHLEAITDQFQELYVRLQSLHYRVIGSEDNKVKPPDQEFNLIGYVGQFNHANYQLTELAQEIAQIINSLETYI